MMPELGVVCAVGVLQLVHKKLGAKLGRRAVISPTVYSQFGTG